MTVNGSVIPRPRVEKAVLDSSQRPSRGRAPQNPRRVSRGGVAGAPRDADGRAPTSVSPVSVSRTPPTLAQAADTPRPGFADDAHVARVRVTVARREATRRHGRRGTR
ncbi:MAG: hypothetical protein ACRCXL_06965 [Dermatophilaceae bacterium]